MLRVDEVLLKKVEIEELTGSWVVRAEKYCRESINFGKAIILANPNTEKIETISGRVHSYYKDKGKALTKITVYFYSDNMFTHRFNGRRFGDERI